MIPNKIFTPLALVFGLVMTAFGIYRMAVPQPGIELLGWTRLWAPGVCIALMGVWGLGVGLVGLHICKCDRCRPVQPGR